MFFLHLKGKYFLKKFYLSNMLFFLFFQIIYFCRDTSPIQIEKIWINKKLKQKCSNLDLRIRVKVLRWSETQMVEAVAAVKEKRMPQRTASKIYKNPRCTLENCLNGKTWKRR